MIDTIDTEKHDGELDYITRPLEFDESAFNRLPYELSAEVRTALRESGDPRLARMADSNVDVARGAAIELLRQEFGKSER